MSEIAEAVDALKTTRYTQAELEQYKRYWDIIVRTQKSMPMDAELKGEIEVKVENSLRMADKLTTKGVSNNDISDMTGFDSAQIAALRQNFN